MAIGTQGEACDLICAKSASSARSAGNILSEIFSPANLAELADLDPNTYRAMKNYFLMINIIS